jgi:hypothetical protein
MNEHDAAIIVDYICNLGIYRGRPELNYRSKIQDQVNEFADFAGHPGKNVSLRGNLYQFRLTGVYLERFLESIYKELRWKKQIARVIIDQEYKDPLSNLGKLKSIEQLPDTIDQVVVERADIDAEERKIKRLRPYARHFPTE